MTPYYIAFDLSHKPRGKIDENLKELRDHLNDNNFVCYNLLETPITQDKLKPYDILVFPCPDFSKFSNQEIRDMTKWIKEDGGGLLLLSHAGGDRGRRTNLGELSEQFGIVFESDQVLDDTNNLGIENLPVISADHFIPPHPITNDINEICFRAGCSLTVLGGAISIVSSNETSEPFSCPLICTSEPENGRVCAIGSYEMFRDDTNGGFQFDDHSALALKIFNWLTSDYRIELTQQGTDHSKTSGSITVAPYTEQLTEQYPDKMSSTPQGEDFGEIDFSMSLNSKSDLLSQLNSFLNQINAIKTKVEQLIHTFSVADDNVFNIPQESVESTSPADDFSDYLEFSERPFTKLPPKPSKVEDDFIGLEPMTPDEIEKTSKTIPKSKQQRTKLKAELEELESKLNSVFNLINFIEKKHDAGKLDDKSYQKQTKKLNFDLGQTKKRIEEIKNILD